MNISSIKWLTLQALWKENPLTLKQLCDGVGKNTDDEAWRDIYFETHGRKGRGSRRADGCL